MKTINNLPEFSAENSMARLTGNSYQSSGNYISNQSQSVLAQAYYNQHCVWTSNPWTGGEWVCFPGGDGGDPNACPRCKSACYRKPAGTQRTDCLANCDDSVC